MQYLDPLEGLRSQVFPDEPLTTRHYKIVHHFMDGDGDPVLQRELAVVDATEAYLTDPPTVESLRFTAQERQRRRHQQQPCDPGCTESVPYQSLQGDHVPGASVHTTPVCRQARAVWRVLALDASLWSILLKILMFMIQIVNLGKLLMQRYQRLLPLCYRAQRMYFGLSNIV